MAVLLPTRASAFYTMVSKQRSTHVMKTSMLNFLSCLLSIGKLRRDKYASQIL